MARAKGLHGLRGALAIGLIAAAAALTGCEAAGPGVELSAEDQQQIAQVIVAAAAAQASGAAESGYAATDDGSSADATYASESVGSESEGTSSDELTAKDVIETQLSSAIVY